MGARARLLPLGGTLVGTICALVPETAQYSANCQGEWGPGH
ncbi:hypothetical protein [Hymenobacter montanus]|nr:hypothetical protein [Hymenobacter montanus]